MLSRKGACPKGSIVINTLVRECHSSRNRLVTGTPFSNILMELGVVFLPQTGMVGMKITRYING
jgi:hypothetical protein